MALHLEGDSLSIPDVDHARNLQVEELELALLEQIEDRVATLSRADDRRCGLPYRYGFATASNREWVPRSVG